MPSLKLPSFKSKPTPALQPSADTAQLYPTNQGYRESASATTRFFRNYPQLLALARTVSTVWPGGTKLDVLHIGGSWGCEALSFQIVMREQQPSFQLETVSTDLDDAIIVPARRMEYSGEFFQPLRENEGGNPNNLREKWFDVLRVAGPRVYRPKAVLARSIRFQTLDIRQPPAALTADIVFCQNVLVHMED
ncbi:MAG TPA: CheR family methyltransferase, partial [Anaerolineae bacterium]|nr:CheR family methyltransferase [Anaerolineae bacterium]